MAKFINVLLVVNLRILVVNKLHRTCAAADRTGHAILHTLYQKNLQAKTTFFNEWFAIDLVKIERRCCRCYGYVY